jgi:C1A family cysteine protease
MSALKVFALVVSIALGVITYQQVVAPLVNPSGSDNITSLWSEWKIRNGKTYATDAEDTQRFGVFTMNYYKVQAHNADPTQTFTMELNKFADLTGEEFKTIYASCTGTGLSASDCPSASGCPSLPTVNRSKINWTATGAVTGVKNQEQCGSCWAFSTTGSIEGLYYLNHSVLLSFSEQQLVDCDQTCEGCDGCWPSIAMAYTASAGLELEKIYPYNGEQGNCKYTQSLALSVNTGSQCVQPNNLNQMIAALDQQPVSIAVEADQNAWQLYSSGIVSTGCGTALDHAVLITGYNNEEGGKNGVWYVKNSWGQTWGQNGYIWISADPTPNGGNGVCGILTCGNLPTNS